MQYIHFCQLLLLYSISGTRPSSPRSSALTIAIPNRGDDGGERGVSPTGRHGRSPSSVAEHSRRGNVATGSNRSRSSRSPREHFADNSSADNRGANDQNGTGPTSPIPPSTTLNKRPRSPRSPYEHPVDNSSTDNRGRSDHKGNSQTPPESARAMLPKRPRPLHEHSADDSTTHDNGGNDQDEQGSLPPVSLRTMQNEHPEWNDGGRYQVVLGESFERPGAHGSGGGVNDESSDAGHYVHLKYDFVPGRTDVDSTATLKQSPLEGDEAEIIAQTGGINGGLRWTAEMEYGSRHTENPGPVRFSGHASR